MTPKRATDPIGDDRIVVGFNGSQSAWDALRWATDEAAHRRAALEVVWCVSERSALTTNATLTPGEGSCNTAREQVDEAARVARCRGWQLRVWASLSAGTPQEVLVGRSQGAVMLVVGRHDASSATSAGPESLSAYCLAHAACPVTVVDSSSQPAHVRTRDLHPAGSVA